jgi:tetratricopeptide (TPR) repeat protein
LRLDPQSDTALNGLARTDEALEQPQEAEKVYREAIQARPYYWANYFALANFLLRRAEYAQAASVLEDGVAKFPANSFLARRLGVAYFLEGQFNSAAATFQKAIAERPHAEAYMDLGQVYLHQQQFGPAVTALEKATALKPHSFTIEADLADAYAWSGNGGKAAAHYREALRLSQARLQVNPQDLDGLMVAAYASAALGSKGAAVNYLEAALQHAPQESEVNYYAARVYARNGDAAAARTWAEKALAHGYSKADIGSAPDLKGLMAGAAPAG